MEYQIKGTPLLVVICNLAEGEAICTEKGGMSWMTPNLEMSTNAGGSFGKAMSRMFSGESMFQNIYKIQQEIQCLKDIFYVLLFHVRLLQPD